MFGQRSGVVFEAEALTATSQAATTAQFGGHGLTHHHTRRPLDLRGAGRVSLALIVNREEFGAKPPSKSRAGPTAQLTTVHVTHVNRRVVNTDQIEPRSIFEQDVRLTRQEGHDVTPRHVVHQGNEFMSHSVSSVRRVVIGFVVHRNKVFIANVLVKYLTAKGSKWLGGIVHHGRKTVHARSAQHIQEHRLGKVVHRVTGQRPRRENPTPFGPGARLKVAAGFDHHVMDHARHAHTITESAHGLGVIATRRSSVMVDVVDGNVQFGLAGEQQQSE
jgi:hypothetical protein